MTPVVPQNHAGYGEDDEAQHGAQYLLTSLGKSDEMAGRSGQGGERDQQGHAQSVVNQPFAGIGLEPAGKAKDLSDQSCADGDLGP